MFGFKHDDRQMWCLAPNFMMGRGDAICINVTAGKAPEQASMGEDTSTVTFDGRGGHRQRCTIQGPLSSNPRKVLRTRATSVRRLVTV